MIAIWIPVAPASPNHRGSTTRTRMATTTAERTRAELCTIAVRNGQRLTPIRGRARIAFTVYRRRLLDPSINLPASLKATQDGVCRAVLPLGDGPATPYEWVPPIQVRVRTRAEEGVHVQILSLTEEVSHARGA